jgi:chromate transport protein ChrA
LSNINNSDSQTGESNENKTGRTKKMNVLNDPKQKDMTESPKVSLWKIFVEYLLIGLTAYSMAILQKLKSLVQRNNWLSEDDMNEGLALVQMYPGPIMVDFTAYVGYKLRGVPGVIWQPQVLSFHLSSFIGYKMGGVLGASLMKKQIPIILTIFLLLIISVLAFTHKQTGNITPSIILRPLVVLVMPVAVQWNLTATGNVRINLWPTVQTI